MSQVISSVQERLTFANVARAAAAESAPSAAIVLVARTADTDQWDFQ